MKHGTTPTLKVKIDLLHSEVVSIDFIFRQEDDASCTTSLTKSYSASGTSSGVTYDEDDDVYLISFTASDTRTFAADSELYMDTKPTIVGGTIVPVPIVKLRMDHTLFSVG